MYVQYIVWSYLFTLALNCWHAPLVPLEDCMMSFIWTVFLLCLQGKPISKEPLRGFSVQEVIKACDISPRFFVRELLIGSRNILQPPTVPPTYTPFATVHRWVRLCWRAKWKGMRSQPWCECLDEKTPTWWETLCLFFTGNKAFISSLEFQDTVTKNMVRS